MPEENQIDKLQMPDWLVAPYKFEKFANLICASTRVPAEMLGLPGAAGTLTGPLTSARAMEHDASDWDDARLAEFQAALTARPLPGDPFAPTAVGTLTGTILLGGRAIQATITLTEDVIPPPPPVGINVQERGARGNGVVNDAPALQALMDASPPGTTLYYPPGMYQINSPLYQRGSGITHTATPGTATLKHEGRQGLYITGADAKIQGLNFLGQPGRYYADGNVQHAILIDGAQGTVVEDVVLTGPGNGIYAIRAVSGSRFERVRINGWGSVGFGLGGPCLMKDCILVQDDHDPNPEGQRSNHGIYIHTGARDVVIENCVVKDSRKTGIQIYGETVGAKIGPVTVRNCKMQHCQAAITITNYPAGASRATDVLVEDCEFTDSTGGSSVQIRHADGVIFRRNLIKSVNGSIGLMIGHWTSWEAGWGLLTGLVATENTVDGFAYGIYPLASNGGRFVNCVVSGNTVLNCAHKYWGDPVTGMVVTTFGVV